MTRGKDENNLIMKLISLCTQPFIYVYIYIYIYFTNTAMQAVNANNKMVLIVDPIKFFLE